MTPTFSIIVPTYNQEEYLPAALDSILAQTCSDWEAVVVNDGSTDGTRQILDAYTARDSRIRVIHKANGGVASALNRGLAEAQGEWFNWLSSDDLFEPHKLECNLRYIAEYPDADFFYSYFQLLREHTGQIEEHGLWGPRPTTNHEVIGLFLRNYISGITICVRRALWEQVGYFEEELRFGQDYGMWLRLLKRAKPKFIEQSTVISRNHDAQGSEVFPAACYFDSARAALQVLNESDLHTLAPFVDLSEPEALKSLMDSVMTVAADPTSFVYRLGSTPLLAARLAEFLWAPDAPLAAEELRPCFLAEAGRLALSHQDDDFGLMWSVLRTTYIASAQVAEPLMVDPVELAMSTYARYAASGHDQALEMERYLTSLMKVTVSPVSKSRPGGRVLLLAYSDHADLNRCAAELVQGGVLIVRSGQYLGQDRLGYTVPLAGGEENCEILPLLGCFDVAASCKAADLPWICGAQRVVLEGPADEWAGNIRERLPRAACGEAAVEAGKVRVLVLGLSPWGGGAERVMAELCSGIDRERFSVEIACLYRSQTGGDYPQDSIIHILSDSSNETYSTLKHSTGTQPPPPVPVSRLDRFILAMSPELRAMLKSLGGRQLLLGIRLIARLARRSCYIGLRAALRLAFNARRYLLVLNKFTDQEAYHAAIWRMRYRPMLARLADLLDRTKGAIVISFMEHATILTQLTTLPDGTCHIVSLHTRESNYLPIIFQEEEERAFAEAMLRRAVSESGRVYLPGPGCARDLENYLDLTPELVGVLPNPTNVARIRFLASAESDQQELDRWIAGRKFFVSIARLNPEKNHTLLIDAVERLGVREDIAVVCIGDGSLRRDLESNVRRRTLDGRIRFVGTMANPFPLLKRAHGLILTSHFEAFGLVLVEAMALDVPTIAVDCPFGPSEVLDNGHFGILVPPDDAESLAEAIRRLAEDAALADELIRLGRERALEYDVTRVLPLWEEAIMDCAARATVSVDTAMASVSVVEAT